MKLLLLFIGLTFTTITLKAQTETYFTARVTGLTDQQTEIALNEHFSNQTGVLMFRADYRSETVILKFLDDQLTETLILQMLASQNIVAICTIVQENPQNIRQRLMSKCFKEGETNQVEPIIEQR